MRLDTDAAVREIENLREALYQSQRCIEDERRVRRQLAIAAANAVYGLELRDARNPVGRQLRDALAASDALDQGQADGKEKQ